MDLVRTTPPRPLDVAVVFPEIAPLARTAIRLHPRPGAPSVRDSSVGGPLLWPADEPWPHCESTGHWDSGFREYPAAARLERRRLVRLAQDPDGPAYTQEEAAAKKRNDAMLRERLDSGPAPAECPVPLLPVAQLYVRDVPLLRPPGQADVLQVLWCPYDHEPEAKPSAALIWRCAAEVGDVLAVPPEPYEADWGASYVPEPCVLAPEQITEYPNTFDLSPELRTLVEDWSRWQAADAGLDSSYEEWPHEFYDAELADAPGWKVGGWPPWGRTDSNPRYCSVCDAPMAPLLAIASSEWDGESGSWIPYEDQGVASAGRFGAWDPAAPTGIQVGSADTMQLYVCPASPEHPHTDLIQ
ncbi:hypothetical protein H9Y04_21225 [Streptomyces sp. TRM66268-LWL]|uniref:DUF1963 domain-containing protein n=1 Tax=Streptomyces polyasparticus TaxID=2767826 RepID=A0ABR7SKF4_9ACTN|nr:hypothetical protein [Streptomyces polyasparticus]MBC9715077.1 hypothetical protein [Streptomyces polyasparticus]